jgi:6-phosphofructokinase 1
LKIGILTGGGDVAPLNSVIASTINQCKRANIELFGFIKGWDGILKNQFVKLNNQNLDPEIGGTYLKASRVNLKSIKNGPEIVLSNLNKNGINGLIVIGGEDTLSNALHIRDFPKALISKTIDNDVGLYNQGVFLNSFTLGHPTASEKIASFVSMQEGLRTTAYSHERIIVVESMGMHAGWLALASSQGNPDFIIIPEFPLNYLEFKEILVNRFLEQRHVIIVVSEGSRWQDGSWISADETEKDSFGHPRFRGTAEILAKKLKGDLKRHFDTRNINSVNPSYLYRSGRPNRLDSEIARLMGIYAVQHLSHSSETAFLYTKPKEEKFEIGTYEFNSLNDISSFHRFVDHTLYDPIKYCITALGKMYLNSFTKPYKSIMLINP